MSLQVSLVLKFDQTYNYSVLFYLYIVLVATLAYYHYLIKKLHNRPSGCNISSISTSFLFRLRIVAASYLPVICCCFIMVKTLYKSYITGILAILLGPPPLFFFPFPRRAPLPLPKNDLKKQFQKKKN